MESIPETGEDIVSWLNHLATSPSFTILGTDFVNEIRFIQHMGDDKPDIMFTASFKGGTCQDLWATGTNESVARVSG